MLADPRVKKGKLNADIGFILKEKETDFGKRIIVVIPKVMSAEIKRKLYDDSRRICIYIQQTGRGSIIGLDECIFKIRKKVKLNYNGRYAQEVREICGGKGRQRPRMVKVDIEEIELEKEHFEALQDEISKVL